MSLYLGIDLGTSSIKLIVCNHNGEILGSSVEGYEIKYSNQGWHEQDPQDWLKALKAAIASIKKDNPRLINDIRSISITGQMHGFVPVDLEGNALHNAIIWSDQRNAKELDMLKNIIPEKKWVEITGNRPSISFTLGKILWFKRNYPSLYKKTFKFLLPKDYIRMKLTNTIETDYSDASATLSMNLEEKNWSKEILDLVGVDISKLPTIKSSTDISGLITRHASIQFNLKEGTPVICGCGDAQAQAIGNGVVNEREWLCTIGTSGQLFVSMDSLNIDPDGRVHTFVHGDSKKWVMMGATLSAGMSFKWLKESVFKNKYDYKELFNMASTINPGSNSLLFLPYLNGERTPHMDEKAKGAFLGLTSEHTIAEITRTVIEGVLFSLYQAFQIIGDTVNSTPNRLIFTGGVTQQELWLTIAANIFNIPVVLRKSRGGGAYGATMLAAVGVGDFPSLEELSDYWGLRKVNNIYNPVLEIHKLYEEMFKIYQKAYYSLKEIFRDLSTIKTL